MRKQPANTDYASLRQRTPHPHPRPDISLSLYLSGVQESLLTDIVRSSCQITHRDRTHPLLFPLLYVLIHSEQSANHTRHTRHSAIAHSLQIEPPHTALTTFPRCIYFRQKGLFFNTPTQCGASDEYYENAAAVNRIPDKPAQRWSRSDTQGT